MSMFVHQLAMKFAHWKCENGESWPETNFDFWGLISMHQILPLTILNYFLSWKSTFYNFYRTWVRSLGMLVTNSLTHSLTHWLLFSKLDWCDPGLWRCQLKICWCCNFCWWESCWQQFVADFVAEVWFGQDFEVEVQARFAAGVWPPFFADIL